MSVPHVVDSASVHAVAPRELITVCRQIAGMMEAEVDILRITRVLRSQTENPRLLEWYDELDHELTMGRSVSEAMARAPELFSPFAVSLVRQGEERNAVAQAFSRLADFLQQEGASHATISTPPATKGAAPLLSSSHTPNHASSHHTSAVTNSTDWDALLEKSSVLGAGILGALAVAESLVLIGWLPARWGRVAARVGGALALGTAAWTEHRSRRISASLSIENSASEAECHHPIEAEVAPVQKRAISAPELVEPPEEVTPPRAFAGWLTEETPRATTRRPRDEEEFD